MKKTSDEENLTALRKTQALQTLVAYVLVLAALALTLAFCL